MVIDEDWNTEKASGSASTLDDCPAAMRGLRVLVVIDASPGSDQALKAATKLAHSPGAAFTIAYSTRSHWTVATSYVALDESPSEMGEKEAEAFLASADRGFPRGVSVTKIAARDRPRAIAARLMRDRDYDLIIANVGWLCRLPDPEGRPMLVPAGRS